MNATFFRIIETAQVSTALLIIAFLLFWIAFYKKPSRVPGRRSSKSAG